MTYRVFRNAFAVMTLFAGVAAAGSRYNQLYCPGMVAGTPLLRGEGYSELTGDITLTCTGGATPALGSLIPTVQISLFYNSPVTSRLLPIAGVINNASEALLTIDEPGSGLPAAVPGFGAAAPQSVCPTPSQGCVEYVSQAPGSSTLVATDTPQGTAATTPGKNVFQGVVSGNSVTFFGIPVLAPGAGTRTFRITNVRLNATQFYQGPGSLSPVQASISISGSASLLIIAPTMIVGFVTPSMAGSAGLAPSVSQCASQTLAPAGTVSFAETYGAAFKTRVAAQNNTLYAGQNGTPGLNGFAPQNVPGVVYNSESNFVIPIAAGQTSGLVDFGTRLKAVFNNVPAGVRLFVSTSNVTNSGLPVSPPAVPGGSAANTGTTGFAQLTADEAAAFQAVAATGSANGSVLVAEIPVTNGSAAAVWEIINTNPNAAESLHFAVYASYTANPSQNTPSPATITTNLSYAASPPNFTLPSGTAASPTLPIPRFLADPNAARDLLAITLGSCSPVLHVSLSPSGNFTQSQTGATYTVVVSNAPSAAASSGTVTVTETLASGLTATAVGGTGWSCTLATLTCTRADALPAGSSYPPITVTMNVAYGAITPLVSLATVSGGGSTSSTASHSANVAGVITGDVTPATGSGVNQIFDVTYWTSAGPAALSTVAVVFAGPSGYPANSCFVKWDAATQSIYLLNDAGAPGPPFTGNSGNPENSSCYVQSGFAVPTGYDRWLHLSLTFKPAFAGPKVITIIATDTAGNTFTQVGGNWTVPSTAPVVTADSVSPSSGTGAGQTFTLQYTDTAGAPSLKTLSVLFNASLSNNPANSCMLTYDRPTRMVTLLDDNGAPGPAAALGSGILENKQCSVNLALSNATLFPTSLQLKLAVIFKPVFAGPKNIYMLGVDAGGAQSGWQLRGNYAVPLTGAAALSVTCPTQAAAGASIACAVQIPWGTLVVIDSLSFTVAVTPNGAAPALTTGQLGFGSNIAGALVDTAGTANSIRVSWANTYIAGGMPIGFVGIVLPAAASAGQGYSVNVTSVVGSVFGEPVNMVPGLTSTVSIPVPGQVSCQTNVSVTPSVRPEGQTEQVGDITFVCIGGIAPAVGAVIPQANFTVTLNTPVTSRLLPSGASNAVSEALLIIDEPGSGLMSWVPGFGPGAPQNICATPLQGCVEYVSQKAGINVATDTPQGTAATTPGKNVFQGIVSGNSVTFYGVPVLAALGANISRVFRITNLRVNAAALGAGPALGGSPVLASISTSGSASLGISNTTPTVGFVNAVTTRSTAGSATLNQCSTSSVVPVTTLSFAESFGTAFKTRVAAQSNSPYAGQIANPIQNVPGTIYNSESNFVLPIGGGMSAGLSDFGTRLKAQFNNVPAGVHLFVSATNVLNSGLPVPPPSVIGGAAGNVGTTGFAQLIASETAAFSAVASGPLPEIPVVNGSASAVWEIINTNPNAVETLQFAVFATINGTAALGTATVNLSYAPAPPGFAPAAGASASDTLPIPRFIADVDPAAGVLTVSPGSCSALTVALTHQGNFAQSQTGAAYSIAVRNAGAAPTSGAVTVTESLAAGLTLVSMSGAGWTCTANNCNRSDALPTGASYPPITVLVNAAANAGSPLTNVVAVSGGGSSTAGATDATAILPALTDNNPADYWFAGVNLMRQYGITAGCSANPPMYCPNDNVTRAQMAIFMVRAVLGGDTFTYSPTPYFNDVPANSFGFQWIQKMYELGITAGCGNANYCPNDTVTRGQMAIFVIRARLGAAADSTFTYPATPYFTDVALTHPYFKWIQRMKLDQITGGCGTATSYCPDDPVTRGQMAIFIMRGAFNQLLPNGTPVVAAISPSIAPAGTTTTVTLSGMNSNFAQGTTTVTAGPGVTTGTITVTNAAALTVQLTVAANAIAGPRTIVVSTGSEQAVVPNGLTVP